MPVENDERLREILDGETKTVAVVGCSSTPGKAAHGVPKYLLDRGYEVLPVNPYAEDIFGRTAADSLAELDPETDGDADGGADGIDVVCVFRPSEEVSDIVDDAIDRGDVDVVWTQLGIRDDDAAARAEEAGIDVVQDRCMKVEHRRLVG